MDWSKTGIVENKWQLSEAEPAVKQGGGDTVLQSQAGATLSSPHGHARCNPNPVKPLGNLCSPQPSVTGDNTALSTGFKKC